MDPDIICPICKDIMVQPIKLPCSHELCKKCLVDNAELVSFNCPICRLRFSNHLRRTKLDAMINLTKDGLIKAMFAERYEKIKDGTLDDDDVLIEERPTVQLAAQGDIHQEYVAQLEKVPVVSLPSLPH